MSLPPNYQAPKKPKAPTQYKGGGTVPGHLPGANPEATHAPTVDGKIAITTDQLKAWAKLFDDAVVKLTEVGDTMSRINIHPGFFQEANTIRDMMVTFNASFVPNARTLGDASKYVAEALRKVAEENEKVESVNLDKSTGLGDLISSLAKLETGFKSTAHLDPQLKK